MNYEKFISTNNITIVTFSNAHDYFNGIKKNHLIYCNYHNYNYYIFENEISYVDCKNILDNHECIFLINSDTIFTNIKIKIEDLIENDKLIYVQENSNNEVLLLKSNNYTVELLHDLLKSKLFDNNLFHVKYKKHCYFFKTNELFSDYKNHTAYNYMLNFNNIHPSINIKKQIQLFNNLLETENDKPKIIVSIATIPSRIIGLPGLVKNLLDSSIPPDKIVFSLPSKYKLFPDYHDHIQYINEVLKEYIKRDIVYINEFVVNNVDVFDYGPCNKWLGAYKFIDDNPEYSKNNYVVIVLDDDVLYQKNFFELLINKYNQYKRDVLTGYTSYSDYGRNLTVNVREFKTRVPLLKGANGHLLPKHFFCNKLNPDFKKIMNYGILDMNNDIVFHDDPIITTIIYYYRYTVKSVNNEIKESGHTRSFYGHNKINDDKNIDFHGVSRLTKSNRQWFDKNQVTVFLNKFKLYYKY